MGDREFPAPPERHETFISRSHGASNTLAALSGTVAVIVTAPRPLATERSLLKHLLAKI